jgi:hypothetical protein
LSAYFRVSRWVLKIPGTLDKFSTKFQEALKIFGQIPGDSWNSRDLGILNYSECLKYAIDL